MSKDKNDELVQKTFERLQIRSKGSMYGGLILVSGGLLLAKHFGADSATIGLTGCILWILACLSFAVAMGALFLKYRKELDGWKSLFVLFFVLLEVSGWFVWTKHYEATFLVIISAVFSIFTLVLSVLGQSSNKDTGVEEHNKDTSVEEGNMDAVVEDENKPKNKDAVVAEDNKDKLSTRILSKIWSILKEMLLTVLFMIVSVFYTKDATPVFKGFFAAVVLSLSYFFSQSLTAPLKVMTESAKKKEVNRPNFIFTWALTASSINMIINVGIWTKQSEKKDNMDAVDEKEDNEDKLSVENNVLSKN